MIDKNYETYLLKYRINELEDALENVEEYLNMGNILQAKIWLKVRTDMRFKLDE
jgi:hypothetical protein